MSLPDDYQQLFSAIDKIAADTPDDVGNLLAFILAGAPFRKALERPELMGKITVVAKKLVAKQKQGDLLSQSVHHTAAKSNQPQTMRPQQSNKDIFKKFTQSSSASTAKRLPVKSSKLPVGITKA